MGLRDFGFRKSQYERPNQNWTCGWASDGWNCHIGPDKNGRCQATFECLPIRQADRWYCGRSESQGGKCQEGPLPDGACFHPIPKCQPDRTLGAKRGVLTFWISALTLGVGLILFSGPAGLTSLSPGPLTFKHGHSAKECSTCHTAAKEGSSYFMSALFESDSELQDSKLCQNCHQLGEHAYQIHGQSKEKLALVTEKLKGRPVDTQPPLLFTLANWIGNLPSKESWQGTCATCHREHRNKKFNLQVMGNQECQTCHVLKFSNFSNGHPSFSDYAYEQETSIHFNHNSHMGKHFVGDEKENAPTTCLDCHRSDSQGQTILLRDFQTICANCHAEQIMGVGRAEAKGIPFLRLPGLDLETLEDHGYPVGEWPADYNIEEGITPLMKLLLMGDPEVAENLELLSEYDDLTDLTDAEEEEVIAASKIIWAIKELFYDMGLHGQDTLTSRLQKIMELPSHSPELPALTGQLPMEVIQGAQKEWLPHLQTEILDHQSGKAVERPSEAVPEEPVSQDSEREIWVKTGGWYRQDLDFALLYRPTNHEDGVLQAWLDLTSRVSKNPDLIPAHNLFTELSHPKAPGICMKCHKVKTLANKALATNWFTAQPSTYQHGFTHFAHSPHFSVVKDKGCVTCHQLQPAAKEAQEATNTKMSAEGKDFTPMTKRTCSACHTSKAAGDGCVLCHNYHVGNITPTTPTTPLSINSMPKRELIR